MEVVREQIIELFSIICSKNIVSTTYALKNLYILAGDDLPHVYSVVQATWDHFAARAVDDDTGDGGFVGGESVFEGILPIVIYADFFVVAPWYHMDAIK